MTIWIAGALDAILSILLFGLGVREGGVDENQGSYPPSPLLLFHGLVS